MHLLKFSIAAYVNAVLAIIIEYIFDLQILEIASICFKPLIALKTSLKCCLTFKSLVTISEIFLMSLKLKQNHKNVDKNFQNFRNINECFRLLEMK